MRSPSFPARQSPRLNRLLAALPEEDYARLLPHLELVPMPRAWVLYESGDIQSHVFFPTTSIVAKCYVTEGGSSAEIAVTGNEGAVGMALIMGGNRRPNRALVYCAGYGYRLGSSALKAEFAQGGALLRLLLRHTQALMTQTAQTAVCNRHHSVQQQLCRFLLLSLDRLVSSEMTVSHELIASLLGVRREGVTKTASNLRAAGLIDYRRGRITAFDRPKLEAHTCECYEVVKTEYRRLLPEVPRPSSPNPSKLSPAIARNSASNGLRALDPVAQA